MIAVDIISDGIFAAVAAMGFGAISDPPLRAFKFIALLAAVGHAARYCLMTFLGVDIASASLVAALIIGTGSVWYGKRVSCPMTVLYIPALLPMVPGTYAYKTVFSLIMFLQNISSPTQGAEYLQSMFISPVFRVYTSPDILGIELGGSLKNVIALAAGIADGLGYGDNTKAALITRGIAEITRLGVKMGGRIETFSGLTGIGDLIVTCASVHSRNRKAGYLMGQGMSMQEAMDEVKMVVEGVYSAKAAAKLAEKYGVSMPIVDEVNAVLFDGKSPAEAVNDLMMRESRSENRALEWEE